MTMGNFLFIRNKHSTTMQSNHTPTIGINHLTVIPTNLNKTTTDDHNKN